MASAAERRQAKKYHSLTFYKPPNSVLNSPLTLNAFTDLGSNPKNTWYDWHLVPTSRPLISTPEVRNNFVEVPGLNGYLDFTRVLSSNVYGAREGTISFYVINDRKRYGEWFDRYQTIMDYIHGQRLNVVLDDDPSKFYHGIWHLSEWVSANDGSGSSITLSYHLEPDFGATGENIAGQADDPDPSDPFSGGDNIGGQAEDP